MDKFLHEQVLTQESLRDQFMGLLLFLVYINDLADSLSSYTKLFAVDTSFFPVIHDVETSDLYRTNKWFFQWKMSFNTQTQVNRSRKLFLVEKLRKLLIFVTF